MICIEGEFEWTTVYYASDGAVFMHHTNSTFKFNETLTTHKHNNIRLTDSQVTIDYTLCKFVFMT